MRAPRLQSRILARDSCVTDVLRNEKTPTCYRAPRWPNLEFPQKIPKKNSPRAEILEYPKNTEKRAFLVFWGYFFGIFWGILGVNSGSPEFRAEGYFFLVFFVEIPGGAISGLCSRSGRVTDVLRNEVMDSRT